MYSKTTKFLGLPQWCIGDHADFLTDMNEAFRKVDDGVETADAGGRTNTQKLLELKAQVDLMSETVQELHNSVDTLTNDLDDLDSNVNGDITTINNELAEVRTMIMSVNEDLTDEITARTNADSALSDRVSALENGGGSDDLDERVTTLETDVSTIQTLIQDIQTDITTIETTVQNHETRIVAIESASESDPYLRNVYAINYTTESGTGYPIIKVPTSLIHAPATLLKMVLIPTKNNNAVEYSEITSALFLHTTNNYVVGDTTYHHDVEPCMDITSTDTLSQTLGKLSFSMKCKNVTEDEVWFVIRPDYLRIESGYAENVNIHLYSCLAYGVKQ